MVPDLYSNQSSGGGGRARITVGGSTYYGAELQLAAPVAGTYKLKAEILSAARASVQADDGIPACHVTRSDIYVGGAESKMSMGKSPQVASGS